VIGLAACGEPFVVLGDAPGVMRIVMGVGDSIGTHVDSLATLTKLTQPTAVAFDPEAGILYVADRGALRQVDGVSTPVARIFSVSSRGRALLLLDAGGCTTGTCILQIAAMALAPDRSLIIADAAGNRVFRYRPGADHTVLAGDGTLATAPDNSVAAQSPISRPAGVAVDDDGTIYISETGASRIRAIDAAGRLITVAGTGVPGHSGDGGPATAAQMHEPGGIIVVDGVIYFTDLFRHVVRRIDASGTITTVAGVPGTAGYAGDGGPATAATLDRPTAVALTPDRTQLFVSDRNNDVVRVIDQGTGIIRTFAGTGSRQWSGNRRLAGETSLFTPTGLDAAENGFLFIVDTGHSVVWRTSVAID